MSIEQLLLMVHTYIIVLIYNQLLNIISKKNIKNIAVSDIGNSYTKYLLIIIYKL